MDQLENIKNYHLYVLKLENNKYYVGITSKSPEYRLKQHSNDFLAARWTKKYKPLELFYKKDLGFITKPEAESYEAKVVRKYIQKYGLNNVRGGDLTDADDYLIRFGYIFLKDGWKDVTYIALMMLIFIILLMRIYM